MELRTARESAAGLFAGRSPLLRLQSDEKLIALIRAGNEAAFEHLFDRYRARLMAFSRHMLASKEDAEDVMQEVFVNAYNAMRADEREINVRPWLYRIARNRCLNHLRKQVPDGQDTMDEFVGAGGVSTADIVHKRADFRNLLIDVQKLPETQRTALLMREIDVLSYDQIAEAMDTTVPSVKSLLVRARMSLAEASQARALSCDDVRMQLAEVTEGLRKLTPPLKRHVRECEDCRAYKKMLRKTNTAMAMTLPVGPLMVFKKLLAAKLGFAAAGHAGHAGAAATGTTVAAGGAAAGGGGTAATVGAGAIVTKAAVGVALTALLAGGAVEANKTVHHHRHHATPAASVAPAPQTQTSGGVSAAEAEHAQKAKQDDAADQQDKTAADGTDQSDSTAGAGDDSNSQNADSGSGAGSGSQGSGDDISTAGGDSGSSGGGSASTPAPDIVPSTGGSPSPSSGNPSVDP